MVVLVSRVSIAD